MILTAGYLGRQISRISIDIRDSPVGYAESISASPAARHKLQIPAVTSPQITELGPPEGRARESEDESAVHEFRMAKASPSMLLYARQSFT